jgi:hypothetical protein
MEVDNFGNNIDDANNRQGIVVSTGNNNPVGGNAIPYEVAAGYSATTSTYAQYKSIMSAGGNYQSAALDTRYASANGTAGVRAPLPLPTVTQDTNSAIISVSNVMPFTSDNLGNDVNSGACDPRPPCAATVFIGGTPFVQTGYAFAANASPAGTITLAAPVNVKAGTNVTNNSKTIWMADGQQIGLSTDGKVFLRWDSSNNRIKISVGWKDVVSIDAAGNVNALGTFNANTAP